MPIYNKLIRDRIPEIIAQSNRVATIRTLDTVEYKVEARKKLHEELAEYEATTNDSDALEELADMLELIHALAAIHGASVDELEKIRLAKAEERGGFTERVFLVEVKETKD